MKNNNKITIKSTKYTKTLLEYTEVFREKNNQNKIVNI